MRIAQIVPNYSNVGGVEYVVKSISARLRSLGHEIKIITGDPNVRTLDRLWENGIEIIKWPAYSPNNSYHIPVKVEKFKEMLVNELKDYDIAHLHNVHSLILYYSWKALKGRIRLCVTPHYHGRGHTIFRNVLWTLWKPFVKRVLGTSDVVHSVSRYEAELLSKDFGVRPVIIEHGVEEALLKVSWSPTDYVIYAGRIEKYKNIDKLAKIVKIINKISGKDIKLKIIGEGPYKGKLINKLNKIGIKYQIIDFQPYEKYINLLSKAMFLGLLSKRESFGIVVNEANAIGTPAVVANPWGVSFLGRSRVLLVDLKEDDEKIAYKILDFINRVDEIPKYRVKTWREVAAAYLEKLYGGG